MHHRMNQYPRSETFFLKPDLSSAATEATVARLLVPGNIMDRVLDRYCCRLGERFRVFRSTCPVSEWGPGLIVTPEIRNVSETYLPIREILAGFRYLIHKSTCYEPFLPAFKLFSSLSWPDALGTISHFLNSTNPAKFLGELADDEKARRIFIASSLVPSRYGGEFGRYPLQTGFLKGWLENRRKLGLAEIKVLDAACGSGEQSYELAELLVDSGWEPKRCTVTGETVEPLELAAAAHGWFPHDSAREIRFRNRVAPVLAKGGGNMISFVRRDIRNRLDNGKCYDLVICNGLLGGPLLHEGGMIRDVVRGLASRVEKGGILLAADRFHGGWRKSVPLETIRAELESAGFANVEAGEGVAAVRL